MARKKDSPQKAALRELMENYLKENNVKVKDGTDVNSIMRDMMSIILEGALDQELDEDGIFPNMMNADITFIIIFLFHVFHAACQNQTPHTYHPFLVTCTLAFANDNLNFFQYLSNDISNFFTISAVWCAFRS